MLVSNAIVEQHEGRIGVVSSGVPGEGSIFFVELPALAHFQITLADGRSSYGEVLRSPRLLPLVNEEGENSVQDVPKVVEEIPRLKCALVVDDSRMNRKMLTQALSPHFDEILQVS